jgi:hypothetical protein
MHLTIDQIFCSFDNSNRGKIGFGESGLNWTSPHFKFDTAPFSQRESRAGGILQHTKGRTDIQPLESNEFPPERKSTSLSSFETRSRFFAIAQGLV